MNKSPIRDGNEYTYRINQSTEGMYAHIFRIATVVATIFTILTMFATFTTVV